jgi:threonylcarbamoyladenosine tRNA methylthiotransferase MtaB
MNLLFSRLGQACNTDTVTYSIPSEIFFHRQPPCCSRQPVALWYSLRMTTFYIEQFGCRATQADAAAIERQLLDRGCTGADAASAEVVVVNTCTVTASADAQARDAIRKIHARNPNARIIATGCYAQRAPEDLAALPGVAWVVGNSHKPQIPALIAENDVTHAINGFVRLESLAGFAPVLGAGLAPSALAVANILVSDIFDYHTFLSAPVSGGEAGHTRPTLKIQDGCNLRCSYCVIPFVRGKSRSLPPDEVIAEIRRLTVAQALLPAQPIKAATNVTSAQSSLAAREIVLSGINLGTWGRDLTPRAELIDLLRRILDETPLDRLRLSSIEPQDVTQDLVDLFASTDRLADHFHMPLQSGSDKILVAMHRWYRTEHYARRVDLIRERLPHAAIGADVIAGFPGETEADHAATLAFIERLPFTYLHVFSYSQRPGTKAASLPHQVPGHIIKRRARELRALGEAKAAAFRQSQLGRTLRVLTLRRDPDDDGNCTSALSSNYLKLSIEGDLLPNQWVTANACAVQGNCLEAISVSAHCDVP